MKTYADNLEDIYLMLSQAKREAKDKDVAEYGSEEEKTAQVDYLTSIQNIRARHLKIAREKEAEEKTA